MRAIIPALIFVILLYGCTSPGGAKVTENKSSPIPNNGTANPQVPPTPSVNNTTPTNGPGTTNNSGQSNNSSTAPPAHPVVNTSDVLKSNYTPPELPKFDFSNKTTADGRLIVYYFFSPRCDACKALRPEIDKMEARYTNVKWLEYDITTQNGTWAYDAFATENNLSIKQRLVPQVLVNGQIITDRFNINSTLPGILLNTTPSSN